MGDSVGIEAGLKLGPLDEILASMADAGADSRSNFMQKFRIETYQNLVKDVGGVTAENIFMFLGKVQEVFGGIPKEVVRDVATRTGFSETRIYGALTSYRDFNVQLECDD